MEDIEDKSLLNCLLGEYKANGIREQVDRALFELPEKQSMKFLKDLFNYKIAKKIIKEFNKAESEEIDESFYGGVLGYKAIDKVLDKNAVEIKKILNKEL